MRDRRIGTMELEAEREKLNQKTRIRPPTYQARTAGGKTFHAMNTKGYSDDRLSGSILSSFKAVPRRYNYSFR